MENSKRRRTRKNRTLKDSKSFGSGSKNSSCELPSPCTSQYSLHEVLKQKSVDIDILNENELQEKLFQKYELKSTPKGFVLLINIITFDFAPEKFRRGACHDTAKLKNLFEHFGFQVFDCQDLSAKQIEITLDDFRDYFTKISVDSCIVCIMSHGDNMDNICTKDGAMFNVNRDILEKFNNVNCPQLQGKPKIFFFQSCRGNDCDFGVEVKTSTATSSCPMQDCDVTDSIAIEEKPMRIPTWTDMLICYSTLDGFYSYRDAVDGSWFIQILENVFRKYGKHIDLCKLLNVVAEKMKQVEGDRGEKQICPYVNIGFTKEFYFE